MECLPSFSYFFLLSYVLSALSYFPLSNINFDINVGPPESVSETLSSNTTEGKMYLTIFSELFCLFRGELSFFTSSFRIVLLEREISSPRSDST